MARKYLALWPLLLLTIAGSYYYYHYHLLGWHYNRVGKPPKEQGLFLLHRAVPTILAFQNDDKQLPDCEPLPPFEDSREVPGWHRVKQESEWYVYSAHIDRRSSVPFVRILTMSRGDSTGLTLYCRWWHIEETTSKPVRARKQELWIRAWDYSIEPDRYYHPYLLSCPVPRSDNPIAVSVVNEPCSKPTHRIRLDDRHKAISGNFVVCLKPLDFDEDISLRILEWLELQYILGADRIYAYVYKLHPRTWAVLRHYEALGRLEIRNHTLPGTSSRTSGLWQKRRHEMVVYNDCFYRHIHSHRYVVNLDFDEAIVPVLRDSWEDLLADLPPYQYSASISVRNVYFFDSFDEVDDDSAVPKYMHMLRHVVRSANFTPSGFAQKSFFSTQLAEVVSNHFALRALRPDVRLLSGMDVRAAHLHHYRKGCPSLMERDCECNYMRFRERDTLIWKFKERLVGNVLQRMRELELRIQERNQILVKVKIL